MDLPATGREYARFRFTDLPSDATAVEVRFPPSNVWHELTLVNEGGYDYGLILVCGPQADPTGAVVLQPGRVSPVVRVTDNPEILVRVPGTIIVKA